MVGVLFQLSYGTYFTGLCNGVPGVAKAVIGDITDDSNQAAGNENSCKSVIWSAVPVALNF